jgi:hypothetical protein
MEKRRGNALLMQSGFEFGIAAPKVNLMLVVESQITSSSH